MANRALLAPLDPLDPLATKAQMVGQDQRDPLAKMEPSAKKVQMDPKAPTARPDPKDPPERPDPPLWMENKDRRALQAPTEMPAPPENLDPKDPLDRLDPPDPTPSIAPVPNAKREKIEIKFFSQFFLLLFSFPSNFRKNFQLQ